VTQSDVRKAKSGRTIEQRIREAAARMSFDVVRIAAVADLGADIGLRLEEFIALGRHGEMGWLAQTAARRRHPSGMWPEARSAIVLAASYAPKDDPLLAAADRVRGVIASYAKARDYHDVIKGRLKQIAGTVHRETGQDVKVFVDTAPLMEKPLAALAGIGWQGKHTNLVSRQHGSWLLLGVILTAAELEADAPEQDHCGSCRRCLDICPTGAFPAPYQLDARLCISYLTIEHAGHIPAALRESIGNRVFGCDDCLAVCPWNKFADAGREHMLAASSCAQNPPLAELLTLDDPAFRLRFAGTPVKRTGRDRFVRNVLIAAGNSRDRTLSSHVVALLGDSAPIVRAMAVWALYRLVEPEQVRVAYECFGRNEVDAAVNEEWHAALAPMETA